MKLVTFLQLVGLMALGAAEAVKTETTTKDTKDFSKLSNKKCLEEGGRFCLDNGSINTGSCCDPNQKEGDGSTISEICKN